MIFGYRDDGNTIKKISVLPILMNIHRNGKIIGDYNQNKIYLYSNKIIGNTNSCLGFIKKDKYYICNTSLKEDIRKIVYNHKKIVCILSKKIQEKKYNEITYLNKKYINEIYTSKEILDNACIDLEKLMLYNMYSVKEKEKMMQGIIVGNISNQYQIEVNETIYEAVARGKFKIEELTPVVGDKVKIEVIDEEKNTAVITEILSRKNYIKRPKLANVTKLVFVVSAKMPKPDLLLLDKQLAFAEFLNIEPVIIINKCDLEKEEVINNIKEIYTKIGYKVIITNAKEKQAIEEVKEVLKGQVSAFSGNSGVGKSTLLNAIFEKELTKEGIISTKNKKGKNTTTEVKLYKIDEQTYIADTPGFSTFDVYEIEYRELYKYFKELNKEEKNCKFVGCTHIKEKECGIRKALEEGKISNSRYQNYVRIYEDLKDKEEHKW